MLFGVLKTQASPHPFKPSAVPPNHRQEPEPWSGLLGGTVWPRAHLPSLIFFSVFQPHWPPCCSLETTAHSCPRAFASAVPWARMLPFPHSVIWWLSPSLHSGLCSNVTSSEKPSLTTSPTRQPHPSLFALISVSCGSDKDLTVTFGSSASLVSTALLGRCGAHL